MAQFFSEADCDCFSMAGSSLSLDKANRLLEERGKVVYALKEEPPLEHWWGYEHESKDTHRALLVNIEPLSKDTAESLLREFVKVRTDNLPTSNRLDELCDRAKKLLEGK